MFVRFFKNIIYSLFNLFLSLAILIGHIGAFPISFYALNMVIKNIKYNGELFYLSWTENFLNSILDGHQDNILLAYVLFFAALFIIIVVLLSIYVLPYLLIGFLLINISPRIIVKRKNATYRSLYLFEEALGLKHKDRKNGDDWWNNVLEKNKKDNKTRAQKKYEEKKMAYEQQKYFNNFYEQYHTYHKATDEDEDYGQYEEDRINSQNELTDLQKAMIAFMLDDLNITQDELKKKRNKLVKSFHPDGSSNEEEDNKNTQKINYYYDILKKQLKN